VRCWLSARHSLRVEAIVVLALFGVYELCRGVVAGGSAEALRHAHELVALERSAGLFVEKGVQNAARALPGLIDLLGVSYLTLHYAGTAAALLWLHQRRPSVFPVVRTTLLLASGLALVGYLAFPTAPPRLAEVGIVDTVSGAHVDLNSGLVSAIYNRYAAVPSMHVGYAVVVGAALLVCGGRLGRPLGLVYPVFVFLAVVATGNHFLFDAAAGTAVVAVAAATTLLLIGRTAGQRPA
jgi:PAP2 superfamily